ncbi:carbohydrate-binding module family 50 protein [Sphaerobolus stellatus SS14]|nr:carbohydrate-binding module family 50 protein [Sphaerobolus stellatus SS14]
MGRWTQYDEDEYRLQGLKRVGYDADTQQYTFQSVRNSTQVGTVAGSNEDDLEGQELTGTSDGYQRLPTENGIAPPYPRSAYRPLLPYALIIVVVLLFVFKYFGSWPTPPPPHQSCMGSPDITPYTIVKGDTCWDIAQSHGIKLGDLKNETINPGLNCDNLRSGDMLCLPKGA